MDTNAKDVIFLMSNTLSKNCACPSPELIQVPGAQGEAGAAGADGTNGVNSFTTTTANFTIPTTGSTVAISVATVAWMIVGQNIFISDGTHLVNMQVTALQASPPVVTAKALGYNGDTAATGVVSSGAGVSPGGVQGSNGFTVLATNNAASAGSQALSTTPSQALSTTLTLSGSAGKTYLLFARVRLDYAAATYAAAKYFTLTIRRTNNTAADLATRNVLGRIITTETSGAGEICVVAIPYTTVGASDIIQPYVSFEAAPGAGAVNVVEASISALQLT